MKRITFYKVLCVATALLFIYLFHLLFFNTTTFVSDLGLTPSKGISILGRRASVMMLSLSILMFCSVTLPYSRARQFICLSTGIIFLGFACMGSYELSQGNINSSILPAIVIEIAVGTSFLTIYFKNIAKHNEKSTI